MSLAIVPADAQVQGPNNPGTVIIANLACLSCPGSIFNNYNNVKLNDNVNAAVFLSQTTFCFQSQCYYTRNLLASNFGF